ncbi:indole-3-glycerol-phosphate synthase [Aureococcus anophagefferens]|nr:indole-3-glycerol-phosphate synthase [Aureococcus anophagefferens]
MSPPQPAGGGHEHCFPFRGELEDDESQAEWRELCQAVVHEARAKHYTSVGGDLASLVHLERLDVSANEMDRFQPGARADALQILQAYSNRFASLGTLPSLPEARFLGFGFNELSAARGPGPPLPEPGLPALETIDDAEVTAAEREEYVLPEGGFKEDLDGFVTIEVSLKSLAGLPAPEGADSAPNSRPGTGKKDEKRKSIKKDKKKDDEGEPAAAPRPDPAKEGCYVDLLVVGAPPETKRTARLFWRPSPVNAARKVEDGVLPPPPVVARLRVPATVELRDGLKFRGLLVSVLKATPPTAEAIADHAAAFGADIPGNSDREQIKLVEAAKLDFNGDFLASLEPPPEDGSAEPDKKRSKPRGTITVVVRLNPGDDD